MHIILGVLGSVVTVLWLLHRLAEMGIDLGGLNPWLWQRRRKWRKQYEGNPIYTIDSPMEATALLVTAVAKADGDMSVEEKKAILAMFESEFHLSKRDAAGLLISSVHLLGNGEALHSNLEGVLKRSQENFTPEQSESALGMVDSIGRIGGGHSEPQADLMQQIRQQFSTSLGTPGKWT